MRKIVSSIMLVMLLLIGCQSTPDKTPVYQKNDLAYIVSQAECDSEVYQYEDTVNKNWSYENVLFFIDASVSMPDTNQIPVYRVIPKTFSRELIISMIEYFEPDRQWYEYDLGVPPYKQKSKEMLESEYIKLKANTYYKIHNPEIYNWLMDEYEAFLKEAPEVLELPRYDIYAQIEECKPFCIGVNMDGDSIIINTFYNDHTSAFLYEKGKVQLEKLIELDGKEPVTIKINEQTAVQLGNKAIKDLGLAGTMKLAHAERAFLYGNELSGPVKSGGYYMVYLMSVDGLDTKFIGDGATINPSNMPEYSAPPWEQQCIEIFVDGDGVQYFYWRGYSDITGKAADNVQIIGFEEVKSRICKQLEYKYKPWAETYDENATRKEEITIKVEDISFGAALLALKDNTKEAYMVPVWYVPYNIKNSVIYSDESGAEVQEDFYIDDALVINAIDGSVVEPRVTLVNRAF